MPNLDRVPFDPKLFFLGLRVSGPLHFGFGPEFKTFGLGVLWPTRKMKRCIATNEEGTLGGGM